VSLRRRALLATFPLALAALRLPPGAAATPAADPGALSHCAAIVAADERLACYDSLVRPKPSAAATANSAPASAKASPHVATAPGTKPAAAAATAAPVAAAPTAAATTAGATAAATTTAGAAADPAKSFGLTKHPAPTEEGPDHIRAQVTRVDPGRFGDVRVSLDNGQAWTFTGPDALIRVGDAVTIRRGALGSFLLTTPAHRTYKAQRSQ
jgi:hypothetical protein